ncbi:MAG TPA: FecR domain-containing protein [Gemmatimonadaceae bacterium]
MPTQGSDFDPTAEPFDWEAIARYLAGESAPAEARAVRLWLDARPDRAAVVEALDRSIARLAAVDASVDLDAALARVHARMDAPRVVPIAHRAPAWRRPAAWLAAAAVVVIVAVGVARTRGHSDVVAASELRTPVGGIDTLRLADGSRIVLGPDSRVTVAAGYGQRSREVTLVGDGWFDVVHDASRPFTVHAGPATIVDVGTVFTVHVDSSDATPGRVAVQSGSVRLTRTGQPGGGVLLTAGQVASFDSALVVTRAASAADDEAAWTRGRLVFRDTPLREVAADLRRWYGLDLRLDDPSLAARRLTATFESDSAGQVLAVIGSALGVELARQGDVVVVRAPASGRAPARR